MLEHMRRLYPRDAANRGVCVDAESAMLGPDCILVRRIATGYRELEREEAAALQRAVLDDGLGPDWLFDQSSRIAQALSSGQIALAQIYGLYIPINGLDDRQLRRLAAIAKAGFNPNEPRVPKGDPHGGEWTTGDDGGGGTEPPSSQTSDFGRDDTGDGGTSPVSAFRITTPGDAASTGDSTATNVSSEGSDSPPIEWEIKPPQSVAPDNLPSAGAPELMQPELDSPFIPAGVGYVGNEAKWLASLTPIMVSALRRMLLEVDGAGVVLGFLLIPTNRSPIVEGPIANSPGASYRFDGDMGILQIRQDIGSLGPVVVSEGHVGADSLFRDAQGRVIGRYLSGSGVFIDDGVLPGYRMLPHGATAPDAGAATRNDDQPKLCPDETPEDITGRSERAVAYQAQISKLRRGFEVIFNGERYDGCRESDGNLLEAKGEGYADFMDKDGSWQPWFAKLRDLTRQMDSHAKKALGRIVEYHFADKIVADWARDYAADRYPNIIVLYTPREQ